MQRGGCWQLRCFWRGTFGSKRRGSRAWSVRRCETGVHRYNAEGVVGLFDRPHGGGARCKLAAAQETEIAGWVRAGPTPETDGVVRWRLSDLREKIAQTFAVHLHERSVGKLMRRLGFRRLSVRPRHPQADAAAQEAHKNFATLVADAIPEQARGKPIELWWQG